MDGGNTNSRRIVLQNNYFEGGAYQVFYSGGKQGSAALDSMAGPGNWTFSGNAVVYGTASKYPAGNVFPTASTTTSGVGADIQAVLNGVNGVVIVQPPVLARSRSAARPIDPVMTARDSVLMKNDPSDPRKPSNRVHRQ